ncbi:MAG: helix-turn-helix transcriptional regulator [Treponema sp.]|uniref:helix-turn-helix domain-containing protein n=1 Tax=Treponema sp. TaxID=166 RepID=UPI0025DE885C|nr:helix-turn-helix transcriptional regulator [Treponema sp.]MBQ9281674.1 helix-turn-helix transcriptional regulator [Treponema sp.]
MQNDESTYQEDDKEAEIEADKVGERIYRLRTMKKLSQMEVAYEAGISQGFLAMVETKKKHPNLVTVFKLAKALKVNPAVLFSDSDSTDFEREKTKQQVIELIQKGL